MKRSFISLILLTALCLSTTCIWAQAPSTAWSRCYGGGWSDFGYVIHQTSDGGYIGGGMSRSLNGDVVPAGHGSYDAWIFKISATGDVEWQKSLGGTNDETTYNIIETPDGGYFFAGITSSSDGDVTNLYSASYYRTAWAVKLNGTGNIIWQTTFDPAHRGLANAVCLSPDGGYLLAGTQGSPALSWQSWIMKLDDTGGIAWSKTYGGVNNEYAYDIQPLSDGGYVVAATSYSDTGYLPGNHGNGDAVVMRLTDSGTVIWAKCVGGSQAEQGMSICETQDSVIVIASRTTSSNGDAISPRGQVDVMLSGFSKDGTLLWSRCLGSTLNDIPYAVRRGKDSSVVVAGITRGNDIDVSGNHNTGYYDCWITKVTSAGSLLWQKTMGGSTEDSARYCEQTADGGVILIGSVYSNNGDISASHGEYDIWVAKLGGTTDVPTIQSASPYSIAISNTGNLLISGPAFDKAVIYDIAGRIMLTDTSNTLPLQALPPGMYVAVLYNRDGSKVFSAGFVR